MGGDAFENENGAANRCTIFLIWIGKYIWSIEISKYQKQVSSSWLTDTQWFEGDYLDKFVESRRSWVSWSQVSILLNDYQYMSCCAITCILITYIIAIILILILENGLWFEAWVTRRTLGVEGKPVESGTIPEQRAVVSEKKMAIGDEDNYDDYRWGKCDGK